MLAPTILIVDDDPQLTQAIANFLADEGYETAQCWHAPDTLSMIETVEPDLLILDLLMPGISGWELLTAIRIMDGLQRLPIVIMTGGVANGKAEYQRRQPKYTQFLPKPLDFSALLFAVEMLLHPNLPPRPR